MKFYAFPWRGRSFVVAGATIHEAMIKFEKLVGARMTMGKQVSGSRLRQCDPHYLSAAERDEVRRRYS